MSITFNPKRIRILIYQIGCNNATELRSGESNQLIKFEFRPSEPQDIGKLGFWKIELFIRIIVSHYKLIRVRGNAFSFLRKTINDILF